MSLWPDENDKHDNGRTDDRVVNDNVEECNSRLEGTMDKTTQGGTEVGKEKGRRQQSHQANKKIHKRTRSRNGAIAARESLTRVQRTHAHLSFLEQLRWLARRRERCIGANAMSSSVIGADFEAHQSRRHVGQC